MPHNIKRTAIPASGYLYQTLVGIRLLCRWLSDPALYSWVKFEADDEEDARGLDDIVAQRPDGLLELVQVKFTVDPNVPVNALSWSWLLQRKGTKGKSLLEKWSEAAFRVGVDQLGQVGLITNRRPDMEFASALLDAKVKFAEIPEAVREVIVEQLGGASRATLFFDRFEFAHSYAGYESLDRHVSEELEAQHTDRQGWLALYRQAIDWSVRRDSPPPDGRITLEVLRATISERQPRPLSQEFRIPLGYLPSDQAFADTFISEATSGAWSFRILWGSPGQGKSTFLSYLCDRMVELGMPFVRHHYFLDLQDPSDRFSLKNVARSLTAQMLASDALEIPPAGGGAEDLRQWLEEYGKAYAAIGKRLIVVIDGLDHVWRENAETIAPMESLFAQLLPLPANTSLILGTQRVSSTQLPSRLNRYAEPTDWVELPPMRLTSIRAWLEAQRSANIFQMGGGSARTDQMAELSLAFERISAGHPLVLTYTFLALVRESRLMTSKRVEDYTPQPFGDARVYYQALWQNLSWEAKDALHLIAEDCFIWPVGALGSCLGSYNSKLEREIGHLMANVDAGLIAFHGSLYVFVAGQQDHESRVGALLPNVKRWLTNEAPNYLRWAWLWVFESRLGEHKPLLEGTTLPWVVTALTSAYPRWEISRILTAAEEVAFSSGQYELAIRKRSLKGRLGNGLTYQLDDSGVLEDQALRLTRDPYPALLLASEVNQSSVGGLHQFAMLCLSLGQSKRAVDIQERMRNKINDRLRSGGLQSDDRDELFELYLEVAAGTGQYDPAKVLKLVRPHDRAAEIFEKFLRNASHAEDLRPIMAFAEQPMPLGLRRVFEVEAVRTAAWIGAELHEWEEFTRFRKHPLSRCWRLLYRGTPEREAFNSVPVHEALTQTLGSYDESEFATYLHFLFFAAVGQVLMLRGAPLHGGMGASSDRAWLSMVLDKLGKAANNCGAIFARGEYPDFSMVYRLVNPSRPRPNDHEAWSDMRSVTKALSLISADIFLLGRPRSQLDHIPAGEWSKSKKLELFALHHWREMFLTRHFRLLSDDIVRVQIEADERGILSTVGPFNEKGNELTDLSCWATAYGLSELGERLITGAYRYGLAYGWRKDWRLPSVWDAVKDVSRYAPQTGVNALRDLAPIYMDIGRMTEDSGAQTSDIAELLLKLMPDAYVRFYRFLVDRGEWYEAERTFAAFVGNIDQSTPAVSAAAAFLWDGASRASAKEGANPQLDLMLSAWHQDKIASQNPDEKRSPFADEGGEELAMPIEDFPPSELSGFVAVVRNMKRYTSSEKWFIQWFDFWRDHGFGMELLDSLSTALEQEEFGADTVLLDRAFHLSLKLQGPKKAFHWLVEAHRHRRGWSEHYHGRSDSTLRMELVAKHYPKRWAEFLAKSSRPVSSRYESGWVIPDVALVNFLILVGETQRAVSVLKTIVDVTVEEFEVQPLVRPQWLGEPDI